VCSSDLDITITKTRQALLMSERRFYDLLKEARIENFPQFVNRCRISKAKELLKNREKTIAEAGFDVGFNDAAYFSKVFREIEGITPKEFRDKII
jgi:AraC-like DNA-binding protein